MVEVIYDKVSGRSRGFGFVTMSFVEEVEEVVRKFNGYEIDGRAIRVNSGPPPRREESSFGGPREGGRFGGGGGGRSFDNINRVPVFEIWVQDGYGARWSLNPTKFIGFLEPYMEDDFAKGWKH